MQEEALGLPVKSEVFDTSFSSIENTSLCQSCFFFLVGGVLPFFLHQQVDCERCSRRHRGFGWSLSDYMKDPLARSPRWNNERTELDIYLDLVLRWLKQKVLSFCHLDSSGVTSSSSARWFLPLRLAAVIVKRRKYLRSCSLSWCNAKKRINVYSPTLFNFINYFWEINQGFMVILTLSLRENLSYWRAFWALSLFSSESPLCSCETAVIDLLFCITCWHIFVLLILCTVKTCTGNTTCLHKVASRLEAQSIFEAIASFEHAVACVPRRHVYVQSLQIKSCIELLLCHLWFCKFKLCLESR